MHFVAPAHACGSAAPWHSNQLAAVQASHICMRAVWLQKHPSKDDECYKYFKHGNVCNQCGPYEVSSAARLKINFVSSHVPCSEQAAVWISACCTSGQCVTLAAH
jgi:hypothetical protein